MSAPTQENSIITVWSRDRIVQDAPLQADDQQGDDALGGLPVLEPETELTAMSVFILALVVVGVGIWFQGMSIVSLA